MPHEEGIFTVMNTTGEIIAVCGIDVWDIYKFIFSVVGLIVIASVAWYLIKTRAEKVK